LSRLRVIPTSLMIAKNCLRWFRCCDQPLEPTQCHQHIIRFRKITYWLQYTSNSSNKRGSCILESEGHADPFVQSIVGDERDQPPVFLSYRYLPVAALGVERGYDLRRPDLAQHLVDCRHGVCIIITEFLVRLLYEEHRCITES